MVLKERRYKSISQKDEKEVTEKVTGRKIEKGKGKEVKSYL